MIASEKKVYICSEYAELCVEVSEDDDREDAERK